MPRLRISPRADLSRTRASSSRALRRLLLSAGGLASAPTGARMAMIRQTITARWERFILNLRYHIEVKAKFDGGGVAGFYFKSTHHARHLARYLARLWPDISQTLARLWNDKGQQRFVTAQPDAQYEDCKNA